MSAMGTQLTGARQLFDKCAKKEVEVRARGAVSQGSVEVSLVFICACAVCLCSWKEGILRGSETFPRGNAC